MTHLWPSNRRGASWTRQDISLRSLRTATTGTLIGLGAGDCGDISGGVKGLALRSPVIKKGRALETSVVVAPTAAIAGCSQRRSRPVNVHVQPLWSGALREVLEPPAVQLLHAIGQVGEPEPSCLAITGIAGYPYFLKVTLVTAIYFLPSFSDSVPVTVPSLPIWQMAS